MLIVFDLDGTLIDSRADLATAVNLMRAEYGLGPLDTETIVGFVGDGVRKLAERALQGRPADLDEAARRTTAHYMAHIVDQTVLYPGVANGLRRLHAAGHAIALTSNKVARACEAILRHFGILELFGTVLGGDSTPHLKPDPEPILIAMRRAGARSEETWVIGDNWTDIQAAANAGAQSGFVTWGFGDLRGLQPTRRFESFPELESLLLA